MPIFPIAIESILGVSLVYFIIIVLAFSVYDIRAGNLIRAPLDSIYKIESNKNVEASVVNEPLIIKREFKIDQHCFLSDFSEQNFPWQKADCLNFEEVFKNYQYYEALLSEKESLLTVRKYMRGQLESTKLYLINSNNQLMQKD